MLVWFKGNLENIVAAATQAVENGVSLAELSASLAISIDTVAAQQKEIHRMYRHKHAMKKKGLRPQ